MIPPFYLVQLSTLPESRWRGLPVFHPMEQRGDTPEWLSDDPGDHGEPSYDVGVVLDWEPDPHFADLGVIRVRFLMNMGSTLRYASSNLWVPIELVFLGVLAYWAWEAKLLDCLDRHAGGDSDEETTRLDDADVIWKGMTEEEHAYVEKNHGPSFAQILDWRSKGK